MTVSAEIQKYELGKNNRIEYFIKVVYHGKMWAIRKRFSDFSKLDAALRKNQGIKVEYTLPPKQWFGKNFDPVKLLNRQLELQKYLQVLLNDTISSDNNLVKEFLEVDYNYLEIRKKMSAIEFLRTEKHRRVVESFHHSVLPMPITYKFTISTPKRHNRHQFYLTIKSRLNRSRSTTSVTASSGSISTPSTRISKDSAPSLSTELAYGSSVVSSLSSMKTPSNSAKASSSKDVVREHFFQKVQQVWKDHEEDISQLLDSFESLIGYGSAVGEERSMSRTKSLPARNGFFRRRSKSTPQKSEKFLAMPSSPLIEAPEQPQIVFNIDLLTSAEVNTPWDETIRRCGQTERDEMCSSSCSYSVESNRDLRELFPKGSFPNLYFNTVLEEDNPLVKDMRSTSFAWSSTIRKSPPLQNPWSKVISLPVAISMLPQLENSDSSSLQSFSVKIR